MSVLPGMPVWLRGMGTYLGVSGLMVFLAFRPAGLKALARAVLGMYLVTAVLSGVMLAIYQHTRAGYYLELLIRGERVMGLPALAWFLVAAGGEMCIRDRHRIEFVRERTGVKYYNDSKGTNPDAAIQALRAMPGPTILIAGGYDKNSEYDDWVAEFEGKVRYLIDVYKRQGGGRAEGQRVL